MKLIQKILHYRSLGFNPRKINTTSRPIPRYWSILLSFGLSCAICSPAFSDDPSPENDVAQNTSNLVTYLLNLGSYLGYNLRQVPPANSTDFVPATSNQLIGSSGQGQTQLPFFTTLIYNYFGSVPVNNSPKPFIPDNSGVDTSINDHADATYPSFNSPSGSNAISVISGIDQQTYQQDPISQAVLNILTTPDVSFCMDSTQTEILPDCKLLIAPLVQNNVIGGLPTPNEFHKSDYNQKFLNQINSSTLLAPLLYSTDSSTPSGNPPAPGQNNGLSAQNQAQEAFNFVRYVTNSVIPVPIAAQQKYASLYFIANPPPGISKLPSARIQMLAQQRLSNYLTELRVYAAQLSVIYGNIYSIFAKRMPQTTKGGNTQTSDALNEYTMATWRLFTPTGATNKDWLKQINQASSATVGKEAVVLLAELNYQLYLMRQQQERLLLTNNILLLSDLQKARPEFDAQIPAQQGTH